MQHWETLAKLDREGFTIVIEKTWEDIHPRDCFDDTEYDIKEICEQIDRGDLEWFVARARVMVDDIELAYATIGGLLYNDSREFLTDGMSEDLIWDVLHEAKNRLTGLAKKFTMLAIKHS